MKYAPTIYVNNSDNSCRFALGNYGTNTLIVLGINPSTADDKTKDKTIGKVMGFVEGNGYDSFIMINLYPQRTPHPADLHTSINLQISSRNIGVIADIFNKIDNPTVLAAWSDKIMIRKYLKDCLVKIVDTSKKKNIRWVKLGESTKSGHPRHPLYARYELELTDFSPDKYIAKLK